MDRNGLIAFLAPVLRDPQAAADRLIAKFPSFLSVAESDLYELSRTLDGDMATATYIKLSVSLASRRVCDGFRKGKKYTDSEIREYVTALFFGASDECVYLLSFSDDRRFISCDRVGEGSVNRSQMFPRRISEIIARRGASQVILAHNHPGSYATPSPEDVESRREIEGTVASAGAILSACYVVADNECIEF